MEKAIKAWAVWNVELNLPCVHVVGTAGSEVVYGPAIWVDETYQAKKQALAYLNTFSEDARKGLGIRLKRIEITVL